MGATENASHTKKAFHFKVYLKDEISTAKATANVGLFSQNGGTFRN